MTDKLYRVQGTFIIQASFHVLAKDATEAIKKAKKAKNAKRGFWKRDNEKLTELRAEEAKK